MFDCCSTRSPDLDWLRVQAARRLPADVVDDVVQETALAAWQMAGTRERAGVRTWLNGILRHKVADHYRHEQALLVELQPWHSVRRAGEAALVWMMMGEIPERYALVLWLRFWAGMTFAECGATMGCSMEAAKSVYRRAISAARGWWLC
jgi:RNA polymerase sigma factor (sigma-70 family)